ncbi:MAG: hypothetical protein IJN42_02210 [Clostridia bacterium]|nr:hypothetical protein [Clostridia bacterium]
MVKDMTKGSISKNIITFSVPVMITLLCQSLFSTIDALTVGRLVDAEALGSVASTGSIVNLFMLLANGFAVGYKVVIGQFFGADRPRHTKQAIYTSFIIMGVLAAVITTLGVLLSAPMLRMMGTVPELFNGANLYLKLYFAGIGMIIFRSGVNNVYYALGDTKTPMYLQIAQLTLHVLMDFLLLGYFNMGIAGLAIAGWISRGVTMIPLIWLLFVRIKDFPKPKHYFHMMTFKKIWSLALPSCLAHAASALQVLLVNRLVNSFGTHVVTGNSIAGNINNFFLLIINAIASGAGAFASQNFGAKHMKRIKNCGMICLAINVVYSVLMFIIVKVFGNDLIHLFMSDSTDPALYDQITVYAQRYMMVYSAFVVVYNVGHVYSELLRSVGKIRVTVVAAFVGVFVRVVGTYILAHFIGETSIYWGIPLTWISYYSIPIIYFFSGRWLPHYRAVHNNPELAVNKETIKEQLHTIDQ